MSDSIASQYANAVKSRLAELVSVLIRDGFPVMVVEEGAGIPWQHVAEMRIRAGIDAPEAVYACVTMPRGEALDRIEARF